MRKPHLLAGLLVAALAAPALAQPSRPEAPEDLIKRFVAAELATEAGRVTVGVGAPDPRYNLAACTKLEPFVPPGTRLWGRARVGLRCAEGAAPTVYVPVLVQIHGPALVAARALPAGTTLDAADLRLEESELTREPPGVLRSSDGVEGKTLGRPLVAGQLLRADYLRSRAAVAAGDTVKVVYSGPGYTVSTDGRALSAAAESQQVRVQTGSGRVLTGTARAGRIVEVSF